MTLFPLPLVQEVPAGGTAKIKVKARLNLHGLVSLESATQVIEEDVEEAQATDAAPAKEKDGDTPMRVRIAALVAVLRLISLWFQCNFSSVLIAVTDPAGPYTSAQLT